ncbi:hypothetical protein JX265_001972 [Neoarthrinium moseri]|uniref:Uncharacterized protein n=2 Tax=Neoarthrinium moseri TaxID=1658444 RepID=A0A9Q0AVM4_9PEZI|nr:hypothetical protein JX266_006080 [Neoarthrinium moseri]KAI1880351.1 hypothetical protein JX265_001972 [Neoarthrinium moseri]
MLPSFAAILSSMAMVPLVKANFDLYETMQTVAFGGEALTGYKVFEAEPDCDQVRAGGFYQDETDVSGDNTGVRCEGDCAAADPAGITILEMHFNNNPLHHWTIYKDRNYDMIGLDGNTYGNCILFPGDDFFCSTAVETFSGRRRFRCLTQFTAPEIDAGDGGGN